jgi:acyl carrier protein
MDTNPLLVAQNAKLADAAARNPVPAAQPDMQQLSNNIAAKEKPAAGPLASDAPPPGLIKQELRDPNAPPVTKPVVPESVKTETKVAEVPPTEPDFVPELPEDLNKSAQPPDEVDALLSLPDDDKVVASAAVSKNFKTLKEALKTTKQQLVERDTEFKTTKEKLEAYEKGELIPEVFSAKEQRIKELEVFEQIHGLKSSPYYKEEITKPLDTLVDRLSEFAESYELSEDVINEALDIEDESDLNKFLTNKAGLDSVGAVELKNLITNVKEIQGKAKLAESKPLETLRALEEKHAAAVQNETLQTRAKIAERGKGMWTNVVQKMREEGTAASILVKQGDPAYIAEHVTPMLKKAATDYGRVLKMLAENGLREMPDELAEVLCRTIVLAHDSAIAKRIADASLQELENTAEARKRYNPLLRPPIGSRGNGMPPPPPAPEKPKTAREIARELIESTLRK